MIQKAKKFWHRLKRAKQILKSVLAHKKQYRVLAFEAKRQYLLWMRRLDHFLASERARNARIRRQRAKRRINGDMRRRANG